MMTRSFKTSKVLCGVLVLIMVAVAVAQADQELSLEEIQQAIAEKGARWEARETSVMRLSAEERRRLCGAQLIVPAPEGIKPPPRFFPQAAKLNSLDWRNKDGHNWTTAVRDQKGCGSCVAFGCMAALEACMSVYFNEPEPTFDLSEQHLFSCGGGSCEYGWNTPYAFNYLKELGAPDEECYPYRAMDDKPPNFGAPCDETCQDWVIRARKASDWGWVTSHSEEEIKNALMNGPLAVYITVYSDFFGYSSGVYERISDHVEGGHIVCMVGWDDDLNCWICKNSWGADWGEDGWFRIRKGTNESDIEASVAWVAPLPAEYPSLKFHAFEVVDSLGDNDGVLNPGETGRLRVGIKNQQTWATATSVTAMISSQDSRITFHDLMATYQEGIGSGQVGWNTSDEFSFTVAEDIGVDQVLLSLELSANSGKPVDSTSLDFYLPVTYHQAGWPVDLGSTVRSAPLLMDMGGDGDMEVVAVDYSGQVHVWDRRGQEEPGFPVDVSGQVWGSPAVGDVNGDGHPEIVFGSSNDTVYAVTSSGSRLFARGLGGSVLSTAALADLDGDDHLETIVGALDGNLYVLKHDGTDYDPFPVSLGGAIFAGPSVAHMDDDGILDIVMGSLDKNVYAISSSSGQTLAGFPVTAGGMLVSAPSLADLDGDSYNEVAIGCDDGQLYVIDHLGNLLFTLSSGQLVRSSPAIADLDGDGHLDIVFASKNGKAYAVDNEGNLLSGWPFQAEGFIESSPVIADMDGDNLPEIIFGTAAEKLYIVAGNGSLVEEYPTPPTGAIYSSAAVADLDEDGDHEIALGIPSGLSIWDYKSAASDHKPWPMYRGNCRRTGYFGDNATTAVEPSWRRQTLPLRYALSQNYPNPFNAETQIRFSLPEKGPVTLEIFNILGQKVLTLAQGSYQAGLHQMAWDGSDGHGAPLASGIYFCRLRAGQFSETRRMVLLR
jgi:C1A family cysteine protease